jgi:hypothetical protein
MVVAHTNDFGVGTAGAIFDFRIYITDRTLYLHLVLNSVSHLIVELEDVFDCLSK